jgi:hypothetical protein
MTSRKLSPSPVKAVSAIERGHDTPAPGTAVKRSVTVRRDLHDAIIDSVGARGYSAFLNEALVMALQAQGVEESLSAFEREHGPLTSADLDAANRRRAKAASAARR